MLLSKRYVYNKNHKNNLLNNHISNLVKETKKIINEESNSRLIHEYCPLCKNDSSIIISETERYSLPVTFQICEKCGLIYSSEYFTNKFASNYYANIYNRFKGNKTADELFLNRTSEFAYCWIRYEYIKQYLGSDFKKINVVMEPGCNDGCNLVPFKNNGIEVYGCDYDENRMKAGRNAGINIISGDINVLLNTNVQADLIILSHVVAHIPELNKFLQKVKKLLTPDGYVYIETPGYKWQVQKSENLKQVEEYGIHNNFLSFLQFEFCYVFELETLKLTMEKNGFHLFKGDEIIRSIFQLDHRPSITKSTITSNRGIEIYNYLNSVEIDYLSLKSSLLKKLKWILKIFFR